MWRALGSLGEGLIDLLWPRTCPVETCGRAADRPGRYLCSRCFAALPFREAVGHCRICGAASAAEKDDFICQACLDEPPAYVCARSAVRFVDPVRGLLRDFKYRRAAYLAPDLVDLLEGAVRAQLEASAIDAVMPVPLHPNRLRTRTYNQSALLAEPLARRLNRRYDARSLARIRDTPHQARLDAEKRRKNLVGAFAVAHPACVRGRSILLVDDVTTSGSTLHHCSLALRAAGAERVWCVTVARAELRGA